MCCGSENNGVYTYYKALSKPVVSFKFGSSNPVTVNIFVWLVIVIVIDCYCD